MSSIKKAGIGAYLAALIAVIFVFGMASLFFAFVIKDKSPVPIFIIFCIVQFTGMLLFSILPGKGKNIARISAMTLIGLFLLVMGGILGHSNFQIEGFFFYLLSGTLGGAIVHYSIAKVAGPLFFNRAWCSWGCWTGMVFDMLPFRSNISWKKGFWPKLRYYHFAISLLVVAALVFGFGYTFVNAEHLTKTGMGTSGELAWFIAGNILYFTAGIVLAFVFRDNRAFCKYLCPITVLYKISARFSILRIAGDSKKCTDCRTCVSKCPMAINIPEYIRNGERVKSTECIMCMNCIAVCPQAALKASLKFDAATKNHVE